MDSVSNFEAGYGSISPPLLSIEIVSRRIEFIFTCIAHVCYRLNAGTDDFLVFQSLNARCYPSFELVCRCTTFRRLVGGV
jgi:hypothetical protein